MTKEEYSRAEKTMKEGLALANELLKNAKDPDTAFIEFLKGMGNKERKDDEQK